MEGRGQRVEGSAHTYSRQWFTTFLGRIDESIVAREVAFIEQQIAPARRVLDLCCGPGRHAAPLAARGFDVVGIDLDAAAVRDARGRAPGGAFVQGDMQRLPFATASFDAVICMWQSFGHFDADGNAAVLAEVGRVLRPNGCLLLDVYHRDFQAARLGTRTIERNGARVREQRSMSNGRLRAELAYHGGGRDVFEWQLYVPNELAALGDAVGLESELMCAQFDERVPAAAAYARMQLLFRRASAGAA